MSTFEFIEPGEMIVLILCDAREIDRIRKKLACGDQNGMLLKDLLNRLFYLNNSFHTKNNIPSAGGAL